MLTVVLAVLLETNDVIVEPRDAMDVDVTSSRSSKGASEARAGTTRDREHPNVARCSGTATCDSRRVRG